MAAPAPHPTFVIIGAERAATRWLRFNLDQHPDICAPPLHLDFFTDADRMASRGFRWYRRQFTAWKGEPFVGEACPNYMRWENGPIGVARRIHKTLPDARLIAIVREPVDRMLSAIRHHVRWGRLPADTHPFTIMSEGGPAINDLGLISLGRSFASIYPFADRFGDQLQLMFYDDLLDDPVAFYRQAVAHIGASTDVVPPQVEKVRFSDRDRVPLEPFTEDQRRLLYQWFKNDVDMLGEWAGRDLSSWDPGVEDFSDAPELRELFEAARDT